MGWRDINMSRRRPQPRRTFVDAEPGVDRAQAVIARARSLAAAAAAEQLGEGQGSDPPGFAALVAGYGAGFACQMASRDNVHDVTEEALALHDAETPAFRAGQLIGRQEALCETRKLLRLARVRLAAGGAEAGAAFLTDCDIAADPMQTRNPTAVLRFTREERAIILSAFRPRQD